MNLNLLTDWKNCTFTSMVSFGRSSSCLLATMSFTIGSVNSLPQIPLHSFHPRYCNNNNTTVIYNWIIVDSDITRLWHHILASKHGNVPIIYTGLGDWTKISVMYPHYIRLQYIIWKRWPSRHNVSFSSF